MDGSKTCVIVALVGAAFAAWSANGQVVAPGRPFTDAGGTTSTWSAACAR
jgi:hypothetical protein